MRLALALALTLTAGCHTGSSNTIPAALGMTAFAVGVAAAERASGNCVAICTNGTACNHKTGFCDVLPCRGRCGGDEHCEVTFSESRCVSGVVTEARGEPSRGPAIVPVEAQPNATSAAPSITPTAEQPRR